MREAMKSLSDVLRNGSATEVKALSAPATRAPLCIQYTGGEALSINVYEVDGDFSICIDGLKQEPEWLQELGNQFTTVPTASTS